jgi:hypothetical protein
MSVYVVGTTVGVVFDGFRVTQGNANGTGSLPFYNTSRRSGGGIYLNLGSTDTSQLSNNIIYKNRAAEMGGGINLAGANPNIVSNNIIIENSVTQKGGAITISDRAVGVIFNNIIAKNTASTLCGGVYVQGGPYTYTYPRANLYNNTILQNVGWWDTF